MSVHLQFLVVGLGAGAVYAALAMALVAVYKGSAVLNFAQGAIALYGAYVFDEVRSDGRLVAPIGSVGVGHDLALAVIAGVGSAGLLSLGCYLVAIRPLRSAPPLAKVVASAGLMLSIQALIVLRFSADARTVQPILPSDPVDWLGMSVPRDRLLVGAVALVIAVAQWAVFRFSRFGLATRAAADDELAVSLAGFSPTRLAAGTWLLAGCAPALIAILASPGGTLNPTTYTLYVIPALAVALIARLQSIGIACVAGLALGALQSEMSYLAARPWWPEWATVGLGDAIPFVLIVVYLTVAGRSLPNRASALEASLPPVPRVGSLRPAHAATVSVIGVVAVLGTTGSYRLGVITSMIFAIIALSLVVLTGLVGQISLAQSALAGTAGFILSKVGFPFPLSMLFAASVAAALGVVVALPALRIRGAQLAVVTLACAIALERFVLRNPWFTSAAGNPIPAPSVLGVDLAARGENAEVRAAFGILVLVLLLASALAVHVLMRRHIGRTFLAVRRNERAAAAAGISVAGVKVAAFGISAFIAGIGGCLLGYSRGQLSADSFTVFTGVTILAAAYLGGITSVRGAVLAGLFAPLGIGYVVIDRHVGLGHYYALAAGVALVVAAISAPNGIARLRPRRGAVRSPVAAVVSSTGPGPGGVR